MVLISHRRYVRCRVGKCGQALVRQGWLGFLLEHSCIQQCCICMVLRLWHKWQLEVHRHQQHPRVGTTCLPSCSVTSALTFLKYTGSASLFFLPYTAGTMWAVATSLCPRAQSTFSPATLVHGLTATAAPRTGAAYP